MLSKQGNLIARVGETEGRATAWWTSNRRNSGSGAPPYEVQARQRLKELAGYFPTDDASIDLLAQRYISDIQHVDLYAAWNPHDRKLCPPSVSKCRLIDLLPFFVSNPWTHALGGKRVTVVSPFKDTILSQWERRASLFSNNLLPDFDLHVVQSPQTQCQVDISNHDSVSYTHLTLPTTPYV